MRYLVIWKTDGVSGWDGGLIAWVCELWVDLSK